MNVKAAHVSSFQWYNTGEERRIMMCSIIKIACAGRAEAKAAALIALAAADREKKSISSASNRSPSSEELQLGIIYPLTEVIVMAPFTTQIV